jgi:hypothetical protein
VLDTAPGYRKLVAEGVAAIGEGSFVLWLVVRSVRLPATAPAARLPGRL